MRSAQARTTAAMFVLDQHDGDFAAQTPGAVSPWRAGFGDAEGPPIGSSSSSNCGPGRKGATASSNSRCSPWLRRDTSTSARTAETDAIISAGLRGVAAGPFSLRTLAQKRKRVAVMRLGCEGATLSAAVKSGRQRG